MFHCYIFKSSEIKQKPFSSKGHYALICNDDNYFRGTYCVQSYRLAASSDNEVFCHIISLPLASKLN